MRVRTPIRPFSMLFWALLVASPALPALAQQGGSASTPKAPDDLVKDDGSHAFDFEIGAWSTHVKRLLHPLSGSTSWVEYNGTSTVRKIWGGRANLLELEVSGPTGRIEGLSLRLYNPQSHQWSLNFSNSSEGTINPPTIGQFVNGRGEFFDQETLNGRAIFVRFVISDITPTSARFEQSFSADGGKTWEINWIATDTRIRDASDNTH